MSNINTVNGEDFTALKQRLKTEVKRRRYNGDISFYGNTEYDYINTPNNGVKIELEHINKIADIANKIDDVKIGSARKQGTMIEDLEVIDAEITRFEKQTITSATSDCRVSCTGMCVSSCSTTCLSSCIGDCQGSCSGTCNTGCTNACRGCGGSCSYSCSVVCNGGCTGGCTSCSNDNCTNGCHGCGSQCALSCGFSCATSCSDGCTNSCAQVAKS